MVANSLGYLAHDAGHPRKIARRMNRKKTMKPVLTLLLSLSLVLPLAAAEFRSDWQGTRPWVGPEYWAGPLYDWKTVDGAVVAVAAIGR
jgi:hypothetical protein